MNKKDDPLDTLLERYYKTSKGCKIINVLATTFTVAYDTIYKNRQICYRVNDKILKEKEFFAWHAEQQHLHRKQAMEKYGLTDADLILSEENIKKIEQDEKRNIGIFGEDKQDLLQSMVDLSTPRIRPC